MKPPPFDYVRAESVEHACALLAEHGDDARLLAGGQSLVPMMNLRLARPAMLIDVGRLPLAGIEVEPGAVRVDALVRHRMLLENSALRTNAPIFFETAHCIGHPTIRNLGTAGGSVAHADPTAEIPTLLVLMDGAIEATSRTGVRQVRAGDLFVGAFTTSLAAGEMITRLHFRLPRGPWGGCFLEQAEREGDFAMAAAGAVVECNGDNIVNVRIVLTGAASVPVRADAEAEAMLVGRGLTEALAADASRCAIRGCRSYGDIRASAAFRLHLLAELTRRALLTAYTRARRTA